MFMTTVDHFKGKRKADLLKDQREIIIETKKKKKIKDSQLKNLTIICKKKKYIITTLNKLMFNSNATTDKVYTVPIYVYLS